MSRASHPDSSVSTINCVEKDIKGQSNQFDQQFKPCKPCMQVLRCSCELKEVKKCTVAMSLINIGSYSLHTVHTSMKNDDVKNDLKFQGIVLVLQ